jgi:hypothetical protein
VWACYFCFLNQVALPLICRECLCFQYWQCGQQGCVQTALDLPCFCVVCVWGGGVEGAFEYLIAITVRDVNSRRVPTQGSDRHTGCQVIIQLTPVPPTTLCPLLGSLALCLCTRVVTRCHGRGVVGEQQGRCCGSIEWLHCVLAKQQLAYRAACLSAEYAVVWLCCCEA